MEASYCMIAGTPEAGGKVAAAYSLMSACRLCPRECGADRLAGEKGACGAGAGLVVSSANAHFGEEPPISGTRGSGTVFLAHCCLKCVFCQNYPISHLGNGKSVTVEKLAAMMLDLQQRGCHNINLVTPTHYMPQLLDAIFTAAAAGLHIPIVYNCSGYESLEAIKILEGVVDIYMPDIKYGPRSPAAAGISKAPDYFERASAAVAEMYRQVGNLKCEDDGIAWRGLIVRHLVLPDGLAHSRDVLSFIATELSPDVFISVMEQYFPAYLATDYPALSRRITAAEYAQVVAAAGEFGFYNGWLQGEDAFLNEI